MSWVRRHFGQKATTQDGSLAFTCLRWVAKVAKVPYRLDDSSPTCHRKVTSHRRDGLKSYSFF